MVTKTLDIKKPLRENKQHSTFLQQGNHKKEKSM